MRILPFFLLILLIALPVHAETGKFIYDQKFIGQIKEKAARIKVAVSRFDVDLAIPGSLFNPPREEPKPVAGKDISVKIEDARAAAEAELKKADRKSDADLLVGLLVDKLRKSESFDVVERQDVNELVREINFQNSDWAKKDGINKLGNISGVQYIVTGKLLMNKDEHRVSPARYTLTLRIYNVSTGEVLASSTGQHDYLESAVDEAVQQLAQDIHGEAWTCKVVKIEGDKVLVNAGFAEGIKRGDVFSVVRLGEELKDPVTQAVLGVVKEEIARVRIEKVLENYLSRAKIMQKKEEIVVGDIVSAKALEEKFDETEKWHETFGNSSGDKKPSSPSVKLVRPSFNKMSNSDSLAGDIAARASKAVVLIIAGSINETMSQGSGFVISVDGYILTNSHVVRGQKTITVKLVDDNKVYSNVEVVKDNPIRDIALLKITNPDNLQPVVLGDSDQVQVGERIVVIGNPEGLENTVSDGLISAIREVNGTKIFQTSAPISHGSSGGAVFNSKGEVIGITTATYEEGQNLNFAVAINHAKQEMLK